MDFKQFEREVVAMAERVKVAQGMLVPQLVESAALKFVDDNFRNQGWEGQAWKESTGTILVKSGALRRGFESYASPNEVKITNDIPYAKANNEGFDGDVKVPEHERGKYGKVGTGKFNKNGKERLVTKKLGSGRVSAYTRHMKLPRRQFAPTEASPSPTFNKIVTTIITSENLKALTP